MLSIASFSNSLYTTGCLGKISEHKNDIKQSHFSSMVSNISNSNQSINNDSTPSLFVRSCDLDKQKNILSKVKTYCNKIVVSAYNYLRSIDGIDEFTGATGQVLPQFHQSLLSLSILLPAIPLVGVGAKGAFDESVESYKIIYPKFMEDLKGKKQEVLEILQQNFAEDDANKKLVEERIEPFFEVWINWLQGGNEKENIENFQQLCATWKSLQEKNNATAKTRYVATEYQRMKQDVPMVKIDRNFSSLQATAMSLMTGGMVGLSAKSIADLVMSQGISGAEAASDLAGMVSNILLLPAQVMMTGYGISQTVSGYKYDKLLKKNRSLLVKDHQPEFIKENIAQLKEIADRKIYYNYKQRIEYGAVTAVGQAAMALSSLSALTGIGSALGFVPALIGAPATIYGSYIRTRTRVQERKYLGARDAQNVLDKKLNFDNFMKYQTTTSTGTNQTTQSAITTIDTLNTVVKAATTVMLEQQKILAEIKLLSLIQKTINKAHKNNIQLTVEALHQQVGSRVDVLLDRVTRSQKKFIEQPGKYFIRQRTSLLSDDLKIIKGMLSDGEYNIGSLDGKLDKQQGSYNLLSRLEFMKENHNLSLSINTKEKILASSVRDLLTLAGERKEIKEALQHQDGVSDKSFNWSDLQEIIRRDEKAKAIYTQHHNHYFIKQMKNEGKSLRDDAYENIINGLASKSAIEQRVNKIII
ncbi:hypothetical protein [Symbiopectobacterium purcellii]|uniref:Uncharacterized protein n=1 Tax=Symbiopectobacterium purcellii TaxID=2871826 RepID=A0ABX9APT7_9ENTR|nr:hypothetical protein [Symbiopectobacterium purcellii]QZN97204.1 hypothetical protein K6K13_07535 [Symbiopectobacterium purcellii]